jgi:hypothetical protein
VGRPAESCPLGRRSAPRKLPMHGQKFLRRELAAAVLVDHIDQRVDELAAVRETCQLESALQLLDRERTAAVRVDLAEPGLVTTNERAVRILCTDVEGGVRTNSCSCVAE